MNENADIGLGLGLFVDPSSTDTGWCVARGLEDFRCEIVSAGAIDVPPIVRRAPALLRIDHQLKRIVELLNAYKPIRYVVETTTGKVNRGRHRGGGAGLATYGMAVGALWCAGLMWRPDEDEAGGKLTVVPVPENVWTQGQGKLFHVKVAQRHYPGYNPAADEGFNIADAVALAVWYHEVWLRKALRKTDDA